MKLKANAKGEFSVPMDILEDGQKIKILIKKKGYISLLKKTRVEVGTIWENKILLSPIMPPQSARFVLSWADKPKDMDIHLLSSKFHISYRDKKSITGKAFLDRDGMKGFGPETITLQKIDPNETYKVFVKRYSKKGQIDNRAKVEVYIDNKYKGTISLKATKGRIVEVLTLNQKGFKKINKPTSKIR